MTSNFILITVPRAKVIEKLKENVSLAWHFSFHVNKYLSSVNSGFEIFTISAIVVTMLSRYARR